MGCTSSKQSDESLPPLVFAGHRAKGSTTLTFDRIPTFPSKDEITIKCGSDKLYTIVDRWGTADNKPFWRKEIRDAQNTNLLATLRVDLLAPNSRWICRAGDGKKELFRLDGTTKYLKADFSFSDNKALHDYSDVVVPLKGGPIKYEKRRVGESIKKAVKVGRNGDLVLSAAMRVIAPVIRFSKRSTDIIDTILMKTPAAPAVGVAKFGVGQLDNANQRRLANERDGSTNNGNVTGMSNERMLMEGLKMGRKQTKNNKAKRRGTDPVSSKAAKRSKARN